MAVTCSLEEQQTLCWALLPVVLGLMPACLLAINAVWSVSQSTCWTVGCVRHIWTSEAVWVTALLWLAVQHWTTMGMVLSELASPWAACMVWHPVQSCIP